MMHRMCDSGNQFSVEDAGETLIGARNHSFPNGLSSQRRHYWRIGSVILAATTLPVFGQDESLTPEVIVHRFAGALAIVALLILSSNGILLLANLSTVAITLFSNVRRLFLVGPVLAVGLFPVRYIFDTLLEGVTPIRDSIDALNVRIAIRKSASDFFITKSRSFHIFIHSIGLIQLLLCFYVAWYFLGWLRAFELVIAMLIIALVYGFWRALMETQYERQLQRFSKDKEVEDIQIRIVPMLEELFFRLAPFSMSLAAVIVLFFAIPIAETVGAPQGALDVMVGILLMLVPMQGLLLHLTTKHFAVSHARPIIPGSIQPKESIKLEMLNKTYHRSVYCETIPWGALYAMSVSIGCFFAGRMFSNDELTLGNTGAAFGLSLAGLAFSYGITTTLHARHNTSVPYHNPFEYIKKKIRDSGGLDNTGQRFLDDMFTVPDNRVLKALAIFYPAPIIDTTVENDPERDLKWVLAIFTRVDISPFVARYQDFLRTFKVPKSELMAIDAQLGQPQVFSYSVLYSKADLAKEEMRKRLYAEMVKSIEARLRREFVVEELYRLSSGIKGLPPGPPMTPKTSIDQNDNDPKTSNKLEFPTIPKPKYSQSDINAIVNKYGKRNSIPSKSDGVARNDPCPCGSGKKYKSCCGKRSI